jgi:alpha-D-ribose 1-methylphosphonate 5-triphosphate diphosphatase PhnM
VLWTGAQDTGIRIFELLRERPETPSEAVAAHWDGRQQSAEQQVDPALKAMLRKARTITYASDDDSTGSDASSSSSEDEGAAAGSYVTPRDRAQMKRQERGDFSGVTDDRVR